MSSGCPQHLVACYRMTKDNAATYLGIGSLGDIHIWDDQSCSADSTDIGSTRMQVQCPWHLYCQCHSTWGLATTVASWRIQPHPHLQPSACQEHVWAHQGPLTPSIRPAQYYMRNVIKSSSMCLAASGRRSSSLQSFWLSTPEEHPRTNAVWPKQPSLNHQGHFDFLIF